MSNPKKPKKTFVLQPAILGALRRLFRRFPAYVEIKTENKKEYFVKSKKGKPMRRVGYICTVCKKLTPNKECAVDHTSAVIDPEVGFVDFNTYIERLFCSKSNLKILCKRCHTEKSKIENKQRRITKEKKKPKIKKVKSKVETTKKRKAKEKKR